jgi:hypothetical protein
VNPVCRVHVVGAWDPRPPALVNVPLRPTPGADRYGGNGS